MISILNNIAKRAKKWMILLIILPLLTGVVAYAIEKRTPQTYTATTTLLLGNFDNTGYNDPKMVNGYLKSTNELKEMQKHSGIIFNIPNVKSRINVTPGDAKFLPIQYTGTSKNEAKETLNAVAKAFKKESDIRFQRKYKLTKVLYNDTKGLTKNVENAKKNETMASLGTDLINLQETKISEPVTVSGNAINPLKRGIFGLILGLMLDIVILVIPEIFREYR